MTIEEIVDAINQASSQWRFGGLQELRRAARGWTRRPSRLPFTSTTVFDHYAFHYGGRKELQFNVGFEDPGLFRFGVAFSFQRGRNLPDVTEMIPRVERFNEFVRLYGDEMSHLSMWHWTEEGRSDDRQLAPIESRLLDLGAFVFVGEHHPRQDFAVDQVLDLFDRLLPVYQFVEGHSRYPKVSSEGFDFRVVPGHGNGPLTTTYRRDVRQVDVHFRHRQIQSQLIVQLSRLYGEGAVGYECPDGIGGRIDVVVRDEAEYDFYEVKVAASARSCIRQALGQLLEYGFWPGARRPRQLIVVGEPSLDNEARRYLSALQEEFSLPVAYKQVTVG